MAISAVELVVIAMLPFVWLAAQRFRRATWGRDWFLAERRWVVGRYHRTRDGRTYHPNRNPEVARLEGSDYPDAEIPTDLTTFF